jgi:hypothetical protein
MGGWHSLTKWQLYGVVAVAFILGCLGVRSALLHQGEQRLRQKIERRTLERVQEAQEVRNEVEALDRDTLKRRAAKWVRGSGK